MLIPDHSEMLDHGPGRRQSLHRWWRRAAMGMAFSSLLLGAEEIVCQAAKPSAYDVEAAYLFNFGKFVRWPEQKIASNDTFVICVLGENPLRTYPGQNNIWRDHRRKGGH